MPATKKKKPPKDPRIRIRPIKLNDQLISRVCTILKNAPGAAYEVIARAFRINPDTFYDWMHSGKADIQAGNTSTLCARFYTEVTAAQNQGEIDLIQEVRKASPAWILSRRFPERWPSERMQMELSGPGGKPLAAPTVQFVFAPASTTVYPPFTYSDESQIVQTPAGASPEELQSAVAKEMRRRELAQAEANAEAERTRRAALTNGNGTVPGRLNEVLRTKPAK